VKEQEQEQELEQEQEPEQEQDKIQEVNAGLISDGLNEFRSIYQQI
jgi:hypothetical protein